MFKLLSKDLVKSSKIRDTFPEEKDYEIGFSDHYNKYLKDKVERFEENRISTLKEARKRLIIWLFYIFFTSFIVYFLYKNFLELNRDIVAFTTLILVSIGVAAPFFWIFSPIWSYEENIKKEIFPNVLNFFGDFKYHIETKKSVKEYYATELIPHHDTEIAEDHITGTYKDIKVDLFETKLSKDSDENSSTTLNTVFDGIIVEVSMNKSFSGKTVVKKDIGTVGNWFIKKSTSLKKVKLEDPNFEKMFEVYSDDQVEARYLLTVTFIERLKELVENFGGKSIQCCFYNNKLLMMIPIEKDMFEPGSIYEAEDFIDDSKSLLKELSLIFSIIDTLKLNMEINL
jgi:hypothetical protein